MFVNGWWEQNDKVGVRYLDSDIGERYKVDMKGKMMKL